MENNRQELEKQLLLLKKLAKRSDKNLEGLKSVPDEVITTSSKGCFHQYYRKDPESGKRSYVGKAQIDEIRPIIQKEYELKVNKELHKQIKRLDKFIKQSDINAITDIYEATCEAKRCLIFPLIVSDEEYIKRWFASIPPSQNPYQAKTTFETVNGEQVKSKSEKIIADTLLREKIPYVYEPRLDLGDGILKYPDFATLNVSKRKTIYWEHFGKLSDADYCYRNFNKLMIYEKNGIIIGDNLIITMESENVPLVIRSVSENINKYLK